MSRLENGQIQSVTDYDRLFVHDKYKFSIVFCNMLNLNRLKSYLIKIKTFHQYPMENIP